MNELLYPRKKLEEKGASREDGLNDGQAKDFTHDKQWVGEMTGLRLSIAEINGLLKNEEDIEDDADSE